MTYRGLIRLGGIEIANTQRCVTYMEAGVAAPQTTVSRSDGWPYTARYLKQQDYRLPQLDTAPWYDPLEPDSKDFAGVWPMAVEGLDAAAVEREVIEGIADGGTFGQARYGPRTIEVEALIVGRTPSGADYGLRWLTTALRGTRCDGRRTGDTLQYLASCPDVLPDLTDTAFADCVRPYERTMHEVICSTMPQITERFSGVGDDRPGTCSYRVKFTLTAGVPHAFRERQLVASGINWTGAVVPITWVVQENDPEACLTAPPSTLVDPTVPRATVIRPADMYQLGTYIPLDQRTAVATIPRTALKYGQGDTAATLNITAGAQDERLIRVRFGRRPAGVTQDNAIRCYLVSEANIAYLPAGATLSLDGITGRAWATDSAGNRMDASPVVSGVNGAPWRPPVLACDDDYVVVVDAPGDVSAAASFSVYATVRET